MGASKTDYFSISQNQLATISKAFSHPARIAILDYIIHNPRTEVKKLEGEFKLSQPTISFHIEQMLKAQLLIRYTYNNSFYYTINDDSICVLECYFYELNQVIIRDRYSSLPI